MENSLSKKLEGLLIKLREKKFKEQLLELTIVRDCVAHPNFYIVKDSWKRDNSWGKSSATFPSGVKHREKASKRKRERYERTKILGLQMVATWISYRDVVMCLIIVSHFCIYLNASMAILMPMWVVFLFRIRPMEFSKTWRINLAGLYRLMSGLGHFTIHSHQMIKK